MIAEKLGRCGVAALALALALAACSPALDWREARPPDSGLQALFPCKPEYMQREIALAGGPVTVSLAACTTGGATYAVMHADVADPARVTQALQQLRAAAASNVGGTPRVVGPMAVAGMTPNPHAERIEVDGLGVRGEAVREHAGFFAKGMRVFQVTVVGEHVDAAAVEMFFSALTLK